MSYKIEVFRAKNAEWCWKMIHPNGKEICRASETYQRRSASERARTRLFNAIFEGEYTIEVKESK